MSEKKKRGNRLQVVVPGWMADAVTELADLQEVSTSEIVRQALHGYLSQRSIQAPGFKTLGV